MIGRQGVPRTIRLPNDWIVAAARDFSVGFGPLGGRVVSSRPEMNRSSSHCVCYDRAVIINGHAPRPAEPLRSPVGGILYHIFSGDVLPASTTPTSGHNVPSLGRCVIQSRGDVMRTTLPIATRREMHPRK